MQIFLINNILLDTAKLQESQGFLSGKNLKKKVNFSFWLSKYMFLVF